MVVSFFNESGTVVVSFLVESVTEVMLDESVFTESTAAEPLPLQAANELAIANANKPVLNEFFMIVF